MLKTIKEVLESAPLESQVKVGGWVRSKRGSKGVVFIDIQDGSQQAPLQLVADPNLFTATLHRQVTPGASVLATGILQASQGRGQKREVTLQEIKVLGEASDRYPLQPKWHTLDFLRTIQHLRFRASTFRAVFRIRDSICQAIHRFFHSKGFLYIHTPIITSIDAEGAGELFSLNKELGAGRPFFGKATHLTVSGQLAAEAAALGLGRVYTFGPTFRAENSNTTRHLAEFWMLEPEIAFCNLADTVALSEAFIQYVIQEVIKSCPEEIAFLTQQEKHKPKRPPIPLSERLSQVSSQPFQRISYTKAIALLQACKESDFDYPIKAWGVDLQTEHEQYLVEKLGGPVVVTDYPKEIKAFYMRQNEDGKTVAAMDMLLPGIGEIIGGSQREERYDFLIAAMQSKGIDSDKMQWYVDTRRFGSVPHSGFGLGLERLVQFMTGIDNIRDVIPFPRTPGHAEG